MLELRDDPNYEDIKTCHVYTALEAAVQIQKRKIIVGPSDSVGIVLFNTVRGHEKKSCQHSCQRMTFFILKDAKIREWAW